MENWIKLFSHSLFNPVGDLNKSVVAVILAAMRIASLT
jgi:hypothetical protein